MSLQAANLYATVSVAGADKSVRDLQRVGHQVSQTQSVLHGLTKNAGQIAGGVGQVANGLVRIGEKAAIAVVAAGAAATGVAIQWQDAFSGIKKTVDGTDAQLNALNDSLKALSTRIPVKYTDLAAIAQEAGALGVATPYIDKFTEAVSRTVAATVGLDTATASEAFGKLGTIFGLKGNDYERLGSVLVALGNAGASTEEDIIAVTQRFAAAGKAAGLSAAQVTSWSSALASLGPQAEAAGSAMSRVFNKITQNIALADAGGVLGKNAATRLAEFAKVSGVSVKKFVDLYTKDASGAVELFLEKLGGLDKYEQSRALRQAGIVNVRDINAILLLAQHTKVLNEQLGIGTKAWADNTELVDVSNKRFDNVKSTLQELWNTVLVGADAFGQGLLPAINRVAKRAQEFTLGHLDDLKKLGRDVGDAIDRIDWSRIQTAAERLVGVAQSFLDILKKVPPEVGLAVASFLGLNKLSGGLLGTGLGNIAGGLLGVGGTLVGALVRSIGGKFGGIVGGALGAVGATPVFVVNWPLGGVGGLGGGLPGGGLPAGGAGGGAAAAGAAAPLIGAGIAFDQAQMQDIIDRGMQKLRDKGLMSGGTPGGAGGSFQAPMKWDPTQGSPSEDGGVMRDQLFQQRAAQGYSTEDGANLRAAMAAGGNIFGRAAYRAFSIDLPSTIKGIQARSAAKYGGSGLGESAVTATFQRNMLRSSNAIERSGHSAEWKIGRLQVIQAALLAHGDTKSAAAIGRDIKALQTRVHADANTTHTKQAQTTKAAQAAAFAIEHKDLTTDVTIKPGPINIKIDGWTIAKAMTNWQNIHARVG